MDTASKNRRTSTKARRRAIGAAATLAACASVWPATAATYTVNDSADAPDQNVSDGVCQSTLGTCTLRAAIMQANQTPGHETVELPLGVYSMARPGVFEDAGHTGDFDITDSVTIQGAGINGSIVDGQYLDRVFDIHPGTGPVAFDSMAIRHGDLRATFDPEEVEYDDAYRGGGIRARGEEVVLDGVLLTRNFAGEGGGLSGDNAIAIHHSRIHRNEASWHGGGIRTTSFDAALVFEDSVLWSNQAQFDGGGMKGVGRADFARSSIFDNRAGREGGGFSSNTGFTNADAWIFENVTFSENQSGEWGGAIYTAGSLRAVNVTIANNHAGMGGGGVSSSAVSLDNDRAYFENSIIADNTAPTGADCRGIVTSAGHSLLRTHADCGWEPQPTDLPAGTNPLLASLQFQQTHYHPISHSSAAKDFVAACPLEDQRGVARPQGPACDIGAYELVFDPNAPVAIDDHYDVPFPGPVTLVAPGLLANDNDPNGDSLTAHLQYISPSSGAVTVQSDGGFYFVPGGFQHATRTFTYYASDGTHDSNVAQVSVTSGFREPPWKVYEVPELPWLDPGPYRFDCVALWQDGTIATQAFGTGEWTGKFSRETISTRTRRQTDSFPLTARLANARKQGVRLDGQVDGTRFAALLTTDDGKSYEVSGFENADCNVLADQRIGRIAMKLDARIITERTVESSKEVLIHR